MGHGGGHFGATAKSVVGRGASGWAGTPAFLPRWGVPVVETRRCTGESLACWLPFLWPPWPGTLSSLFAS